MKKLLNQSWLSKVLLLVCACAVVGSVLGILWAQRNRFAGPQEGRARRATETDQSSIKVTRGDDLQAAIDRARAGDTIILEAGANFNGPLTLPAKPGNAYITIQSSALSALPSEQERVSPQNAAAMPKIVSPGKGQPAIKTEPGAHHYRLVGIEFKPTGPSAVAYDLIDLGDGSNAQNSLNSVPHDIIIDRCYVHGDRAGELKRGIALNSASTRVINSYISDCKADGQDSQAIGGWNGPGPYQIINNYLEAAGENIMFGGADPHIQNLVPSDIQIARNHFTKPLEWRNSRWQVKNLLELKNAQRVMIEGNVFENSWQAAQGGMAIVLTPRNQENTAPWSTVNNVVVRNNVVRHVNNVIGLLSTDDTNRSRTIHDITVSNNLCWDVSAKNWGEGSSGGVFVSLNGPGAINITVAHNTVVESGMGLVSEQNVTVTGLVIRDNLMHWQIIGGDGLAGTEALDKFASNTWIVDHNVIVMDDASYWPGKYPPGNTFPNSYDKVGFTDYAGGDYRLKAGSRYKGKASDQRDVGVDFNALLSSLSPPDRKLISK
ncbi:MAG: hypothetical protein M3362_22540 [Acidobacteriota bacterium]|nr:hypothetical protein [Acidobacteriota bacterium]